MSRTKNGKVPAAVAGHEAIAHFEAQLLRSFEIYRTAEK